MTHSPDDVVTEFCAKWTKPDPAELASYFTEDGVYHNIPMQPVAGREAITAFITEFTAMVDGIDFRVHSQVSSGNLVFNERTDVMRFTDGRELPLPVAGSSRCARSGAACIATAATGRSRGRSARGWASR
jgi:limonene-1,2-epoxide hydrolase